MGHTSKKIVPQRLLLVFSHAAQALPPACADTSTARAHACAPARGAARARPAPSRLCVGHGYLCEGSAAGGAGAGTCGSAQRGPRPRAATAGRSGTPPRVCSAAPARSSQLPSVLLPCPVARPSRSSTASLGAQAAAGRRARADGSARPGVCGRGGTAVRSSELAVSLPYEGRCTQVCNIWPPETLRGQKMM